MRMAGTIWPSKYWWRQTLPQRSWQLQRCDFSLLQGRGQGFACDAALLPCKKLPASGFFTTPTVTRLTLTPRRRRPRVLPGP
jgi:hypothetical protein